MWCEKRELVTVTVMGFADSDFSLLQIFELL
jgi:hypothetical protein